MPRPFRFSLQKVLDYRLQLEEEAKQAMALAQRAYQAQTRAVDGLRRALAANEAEMYQKSAEGAHAMWLWRNYEERLKTDLSQAEQRALHLARELNKARRKVVHLAKERKLLEKLKQNQMVRHVQEENRREQNELDEMATLRYRHNPL